MFQDHQGSSIGKTMLWFPLLLSLATGALGVLPDFGICPAVKTVENFDMQKGRPGQVGTLFSYGFLMDDLPAPGQVGTASRQVGTDKNFLGKWYEAERYFSILSVGTKCSTSNYTMNEDGALRVIESHISTILTGREKFNVDLGSLRSDSSEVGIMAPDGKSTEPKYNVRFDTGGVPYAIPYTMSYWILGTDYDNYAVVWSCANVGLFSLKSAWIMTRQRQPSVSVVESAYQILDRNQISRAYLFRTDQKNCPEVY